MASHLVLRIEERYSKLTAGEQKLARLVLDRQNDIMTYSATEIAEMAGVSKATAARFFRHLGYADFNDVKLQAREERNRAEPYEGHGVDGENFTLGRAIGAHLDVELKNLTRTFEEMRSDTVREAADLIGKAGRLWVLGLGSDEGYARYARLVFSRLRHSVMILGINQGSWAEDLAMAGPDDVLLLVSLPPRSRSLQSILSYAETSRLKLIAIADNGSMLELKRYCRVVLPCHVSSLALGPSYTAVGSVIRLLALTFATQNAKTAQQRAAIVEAIRDELDDLR